MLRQSLSHGGSLKPWVCVYGTGSSPECRSSAIDRFERFRQRGARNRVRGLAIHFLHLVRLLPDSVETALSSLGLRLDPELHFVKMIDQETFPESSRPPTVQANCSFRPMADIRTAGGQPRTSASLHWPCNPAGYFLATTNRATLGNKTGQGVGAGSAGKSLYRLG